VALTVLEKLEGRRLRLRQQLDADWMADAIVGPDDRGQPCLLEVTVRSGFGGRQGGLTASLWRRIRIGDISRGAITIWQAEFGALEEWRPKLARELTRWPTDLGRRPVPDWYYALLAEAFEERIRGGSKEPLNDLARWLKVGRSTVDRRITEARTRGLLERARAAHGGVGGAVTSRGREVLRKHMSEE
jgi:hypothetical protein